MKKLINALAATLVLFAGAATLAQTGATRASPDYTVYVDPPTGFVFVKLPQGWKFAGKVDEKDLAQLPPWVTTALLPAEASTAALPNPPTSR